MAANRRQRSFPGPETDEEGPANLAPAAGERTATRLSPMAINVYALFSFGHEKRLAACVCGHWSGASAVPCRVSPRANAITCRRHRDG